MVLTVINFIVSFIYGFVTFSSDADILLLDKWFDNVVRHSTHALNSLTALTTSYCKSYVFV